MADGNAVAGAQGAAAGGAEGGLSEISKAMLAKITQEFEKKWQKAKAAFTKEQWDIFTKQTNGDFAARVYASVNALDEKLEALKISKEGNAEKFQAEVVLLEKEIWDCRKEIKETQESREYLWDDLHVYERDKVCINRCWICWIRFYG